MRTTLTTDDDAAARIGRRRGRHDGSFGELVNDRLRRCENPLEVPEA